MKYLAHRTLALAVVACLAQAGSAQAAPTVSIEVSSAHTPPAPGETITFKGTTNVSGPVWYWDFDYDCSGQSQAQVQQGQATMTHAYSSRGKYCVLAVAYDPAKKTYGWSLIKDPALLVDSLSASFTHSGPPTAGSPVTFTSTSAVAPGGTMSYDWDFDGDGTTDAHDASASFTYPAPGDYTAKLTVTDDLGMTSSATQTFSVADAPRGEAPGGGSGTGSDSGSSGGSGSGSGSSSGSGSGSPPADQAPPAGGGQAPPANAGFDSSTPSTPAVVLPSMLNPLPFIHIKGRTTGRGAQITLFTVKAPAGARVTVSCVAKRGCPRKSGVRRIKARKGRKTGLVRIRWIEGFRRAGTIIKVRVTKAGFTGRYTQFRIGRLKPPVRWDGCLYPGRGGRPTDCQGGS